MGVRANRPKLGNRWIGVVAVLGAGILVAGTAGIMYLLMHDARQDISLADIASSSWSPDPSLGLSSLRCGGVVLVT
jgi:hypothetical protein